MSLLVSLVSLLLAANVTYSPPVAYDISLAGNFGEPRPNHFHGGIDIKTGGVEGKPIYSIADGYVSRVTVGLLGFGNAVYVTHPDGRTSVYCHLRSFTPRIERLLRRWQYEHKTSVADARFSPLDCPVSRGQLIAVSGNTGASSAPHLHLELHETRTGNMLDPLDALGSYVSDGQPPMAHGFMAYPVSGEGTFCGGAAKQSFGFSSHNLSRRFTAWGKVGFGLWANDYMEITYNRYGVRETILDVDGREVFHSVVDNIPVQSNRMVNSWGDYEHYLRFNVWYMKSFVEEGNTLPILTADERRGIVDFSERRDYHLRYTLKDFRGNTSVYTFTVSAAPAPIAAAKQPNPRLLMRCRRTNVYSSPGMQLTIPVGTLPRDVELRPQTAQQRQGCLSPQYTFYNVSLPLFSYAELSIAVRGEVKDPSKLYIVSHYGTPRFHGGVYRNGWVTGRVRELGAKYELAYDDEPPTVSGVGQGLWSASHVLRLSVNDAKSGLKGYEAYIDGHFVVFQPVEKSQQVLCRLAETPIKRTGRTHHLKFVATDNRDNKRAYEADFIY